MSVAISIQNLSKKYKLTTATRYVALRDVIASSFKNLFQQKSAESFWALKDINLEINEGERIGIIGHNGAGKSTLLKIISRITPPTTGTITLDGRVASLLEVGTGFHPELTGRENIYLNGSILGLTKKEIDKKLDAIIDFSGVEQFIDTPLKHYSSGMQLRLAFSVAAHLEPEILLIDEVLAVGDIEFQKKCIGKMEEVSKQHGRTILFVSHNIGFIQSFCTRAMLLEKGKVIAEGNTNDVVNKYIQSTNKQNVFKNVFGSKKAELTDFTIKYESIPTQQLLLGYPATFIVVFKALENLNNVEVAFNIKNLHTELITHITNIDKQFYIAAKKNDVVQVAIELKHINLTPGVYKVDVFILNNGEMCWGCHNFEEITILNSDKALRPNGFPSHVKTFTDSKWAVKQL